MDRKDLILPRRKAIVLLVGATASALSTPSEVQAAPTETPTPPGYIPNIKPLDRLKRSAEDLSTQPLSVNQAEQVLEQLSDWNVSRNDEILDDPSLAKRTYFLTFGPGTVQKPDFDPQVNILNSKVITNFYERYPDYPYNVETAKRLLAIYNEGYMGATPTEAAQESFVNLDNTNNVNGFVKLPKPVYQYHGLEAHPIQTDPTPAITLISTAEHEWVHQKYWGDRTNLDPEIIDYLRNFGGRPNNNTFKGFHDNFSITYISESPDGGKLVTNAIKLNEFSTDYISTSLLKQDGLPFFTGYGRLPVDYFNFNQVLEQSGFQTLKSFVDLYSLGQIKNLYEAVGLGAEKGGRKLFSPADNRREMLGLAINMFPFWDYPEWNPDPRTRKPNITEYFRNIAA